jgi:Holliday junction resolvasome RuvABC ATP-dependent DNA helicase subunit
MARAPSPHEPRSGKTTLAQIVARGLGVGFRATSGPVHPARRRPSTAIAILDLPHFTLIGATASAGVPSRSALHRQPR